MNDSITDAGEAGRGHPDFVVTDPLLDRAFEQVVQLAGRLFEVPKVMVTLVDERYEHHIKAHVGFGEGPLESIPALCNLALWTDGVLVVEDARHEVAYMADPFVMETPGIRFMAGVGLRLASGHVIGTLCLFDERRRAFTEAEEVVLMDLALVVVDQVMLRQARATAANDIGSLRARLANMHHRIRTPLTSIIGFSDLLLDRVETSNRRYAQFIHDSAQRLLYAMERVLDLGHGGGGPEEAATAEVERVIADESAPQGSCRGRQRLLAVEDSPEIQALLEYMLHREYDLSLAGGVDEALRLASAQGHDLVLLDINLGEQRTGWDVLRALRQMAAYQEVPIVACTAYGMPGDATRFLEAGFDGYISKPLTRAMLRETLSIAHKRG